MKSVVFFPLGLSLLILSLPSLGLGLKSTSLSPGFCVALGGLQEAGDADSRACTRSQVWLEYNIPYISTSITLPHLYQRYHDHCIVISSNEGMGAFGGRSFMLGFGWGDRSWVSYFFYFFFFFYVFVLLVIFLSWLVDDSSLCV